MASDAEEGYGIPTRSYLLVAVPKPKKSSPNLDLIDEATKPNRYSLANFSFTIPALSVGSMDTLYTLLEDLTKYDSYIESILRKIGRQRLDLTKKADREHVSFEITDKVSAVNYLTGFTWDIQRFNPRRKLNELSNMLFTEVQKLDEDLKTKSGEYNAVVNTIKQREKRETGSLVARDLTNCVDENVLIDSDYLTTLLVVVPISQTEQWQSNYETLVPNFIVPRSSKCVYSDKDNRLWTVILFKKGVEDFKGAARERKWTVRKYERTEGMDPAEISKLKEDKAKLKKALTRWCDTNFADCFIHWIHIKCIRCFVESALRFGVPPNFDSILIWPAPKQEEKVRKELARIYQHLGTGQQLQQKGDASAPSVADEIADGDLPVSLVSSNEKFYPYVSLDINLDLKYEARD